ncbi:LOW QUALITY PROTEIN: XK-related protein 4 [Leucoraja erinacea]|uniref:LOW QUALITY PROTEIN: XK-related protein 4 n=1 Tax=Leucoraja erinaceus TaxID=7782 RepID=UPI0024571A82|nr:LOW QUALITY PROTEIN: XK-related protein 4 [Leucoraja erinacea]
MAAKSDGLLKMMKKSDVAFTPLQNSEHSSNPAAAAGAASAPGAGAASGAASGAAAAAAGSSGSRGTRRSGSGAAPGTAHPSCCLRFARHQRYTLWDGLWIVAAVTVYFSDVGTDVWLAVDYYLHSRYWWFGLTLFFVVLGSLAVQVFSFRWFIHDFSASSGAAVQSGSPVDGKVLGSAGASGETDARSPQRQPSNTRTDNTSKSNKASSCSFCVWLLQSIIHILQLGQLWRYLRTIYLGIRSRQSGGLDRWRFYWNMVYEYADVSMLHLLATFLESAPQLVLQLCIVIQSHRLEALQGLTAAASLVSLSWALASYQKALRDSRNDKKPISYLAVIIQFCWHFFTIAARVITFALFASVFQLYFGIFIVLHWCIMTFWIVHCETEFCITKWEEIVFDMVVGIIYIFSWFNVKEGRTRCRLFIYYFGILLENTALSALWYLYRAPQITDAFAIPALCVVFSSFLTGIVFMLMYYAFFHPNGPRFGQSPSCACKEPVTTFNLPVDASANTLRSVSQNREQKLPERDSCMPVFQVRPTAPSTPSSRTPRIEETVIKIDLLRNKYPAWDRHVLDRSLRKAILGFECASSPPQLQYKNEALIEERLEYETTL